MGSQRSLSDFFLCGTGPASSSQAVKRGRASSPPRGPSQSRLVTCPICSKSFHKLVAAAHVDTHFAEEEGGPHSQQEEAHSDEERRQQGGEGPSGDLAADVDAAEAADDGDEARRAAHPCTQSPF